MTAALWWWATSIGGSGSTSLRMSTWKFREARRAPTTAPPPTEPLHPLESGSSYDTGHKSARAMRRGASRQIAVARNDERVPVDRAYSFRGNRRVFAGSATRAVLSSRRQIPRLNGLFPLDRDALGGSAQLGWLSLHGTIPSPYRADQHGSASRHCHRGVPNRCPLASLSRGLAVLGRIQE